MTPRPWHLSLFFSALLASSVQAQDDYLNQVAEHHADLAHATYGAAHQATLELQDRIDDFLDAPSEAGLVSAREAWVAAKDIYSQSEAFRFGHPPVDEWEVQVNAWPLDEGLIDYVESDQYFYEVSNAYGEFNLIGNPEIPIGPEDLSTADITPELLASLNEVGGSEANVATGWHAIEFLLWGQDLNGTGPGAGERPATDFASGDNCTHGHCERRGQYLRAATQLLVDDLASMTREWSPEVEGNYRKTFLALPQDEQVRRILYAVGSLSLGELAGERMRVALFANSPEDEQDCFSDITHHTLFYNFQGVRNVLQGEFSAGNRNLDGPSIMGWLESNNPDLAESLQSALENATTRLDAIYQRGEAGQRFDQLIAPGNREGAQLINQAIQALVSSTGQLVEAGAALGMTSFEPDTAGHF